MNNPDDFNFDEFDKPASEWVDDTPELTPSTGNISGILAESVDSQPVNQEASHDTHSETLPEGVTKLYKFRTLAELCKKPEPIRFLIEDYVQEGALHLDYGESGCGKTFVALDQALSIACEEIHNWHGMKIRHAPVIYLAGEGSKGLIKRCALWIQERNINPQLVKFGVIEEAFKLDDNSDVTTSIQNTIGNIKFYMQKMKCTAPALIIIDTLHRYMNGDENKAVDVSKFITACTILMQEFGCAIKIIHHVGNAGENKSRPRGSSSLTADFDITTLYQKTNSTISVDQTKNKDSVAKKGLKFTLKQGALPDEWNNDEKPTTSCTIELSPYSSHTQPYIPETNAPKKLSTIQQRARKTFKEAVERYGIQIHDDKTGHELAAVEGYKWKEVSCELSIAETKEAKERAFFRDCKQIYEKDELLIKRIIEGREYYCLDIQTDGEDNYRTAILHFLQEHKQSADNKSDC